MVRKNKMLRLFKVSVNIPHKIKRTINRLCGHRILYTLNDYKLLWRKMQVFISIANKAIKW